LAAGGDSDNDDNDDDSDGGEGTGDDASAVGLLDPALAASLRPVATGVTFADIAGQAEAKQALKEALILPLRHAATMRRMGLQPPVGVLLYGPPGTGKTLLAKAVATAMGGRFINLSIPSILRSGVGDSERALAAAFDAAVLAAPSVVFLDEFQALFVNRDSGDSGGDESSRMAAMLTSQLLLSLDALRTRQAALTRPLPPPVLVLAATNVPEVVDTALLRPGRFERVVHVGLPAHDERLILMRRLLTRALLVDPHRKPAAAGDASTAEAPRVDVETLVQKVAIGTAGFTGADITNVVRRAVSLAVQRGMQQTAGFRSFSDPLLQDAGSSVPVEGTEWVACSAAPDLGVRYDDSVVVEEGDVLQALASITPSVPPELAKQHIAWGKQWRTGK
jgi:SpoVK/Ycf46/Vps4 family AAA+-type ATPase